MSFGKAGTNARLDPGRNRERKGHPPRAGSGHQLFRHPPTATRRAPAKNIWAAPSSAASPGTSGDRLQGLLQPRPPFPPGHPAGRSTAPSGGWAPITWTLYIIHRFDYDTPIEETMEALHDLVRAGKVRGPGRLGHVRLPVLQHAARRPRPRLDPLLGHGKPLQPSLPGGRAGADPHLPPDGRLADALQPPGRRPPDPPHLGSRTLRAKTDRVRYGQVRPDGAAGHPDRPAGSTSWPSRGLQDVPGRHRLAVGQRGVLPPSSEPPKPATWTMPPARWTSA